MKTRLVLAVACFVSVGFAHNSYTGGYSGAPGRNTCASSCHGGTGGTLYVTGFPTTYQPLQTYAITIRHNGGSRIVNFNATTRLGTTSTVAGTFTAGLNSILYTGADGGAYANPHSIDSAIFQWTAPAAGAGTVNFYAAAFQGTTSSSSGQSARVTLSASEGLTSAPDPPVHVSPASGSVGNLTSLRIVWRTAARANSYRLQVATDTGFTTLVVHDSTLTDTSRLVTGLQPLTTYYWRLNASNPVGGSTFSTQWNFRTLGVPTQVTTLSPPNNSDNQPTTIAFRWRSAFDQTLTPLYHPGRSGDSPESILGYWHAVVTDTVTLAGLVQDTTVTDTTKTMSGLSNLTTYFWRVKAKNQAGWGGFSSWWRFTTIVQLPAQVPLVAPANNSTISADSTRLIWNRAAPQVIRYWVEWATDSTFTTPQRDSSVADTTRILRQLLNNQSYWWRVRANNSAGWGPFGTGRRFSVVITGTEALNGLPTEFRCEQNYPNPFNPVTNLQFSIPNCQLTTLKVYDVLGREVATLVNEVKQPGTYSVQFNGSGLGTGIYFYRLDAGPYTSVKKLLLLK